MTDIVTLNELSQQNWQAAECEHLRYEYPLTSEDLVLDVGAYRGEFSQEILRRYACRIVAIEPTDSILQATLLTSQIHGLPTDRVRVINKAAGRDNRPIKFGGQFLYTNVFEPPTREFPGIDINEAVRECGEIALCKMNVEGSEYDLLPRLFEEDLQVRIRDLQVQFHQIAGRPYEIWYDRICETLNKTHYLTWVFPFCWENWRRRR